MMLRHTLLLPCQVSTGRRPPWSQEPPEKAPTHISICNHPTLQNKEQTLGNLLASVHLLRDRFSALQCLLSPGAKSVAPDEPCQGLSVLSLGQCGGTDGKGEKPRRKVLLVQMGSPKTNLPNYFLLTRPTSSNSYPVTDDPEIRKVG